MKKSESVLTKVIKRIIKKPGTLLVFAVLISCNVFAWFIYTTKVDSEITAHVKAWNVDFEVGNTALSQQINFDIDNIYPGMTTYTETITATNNGETRAEFSYEIISATILGTSYTVNNMTLFSDDLLDQLENDYPFTIAFMVDNSNLVPGGGTGTFSLSISWPYESGDDASDTYWGDAAYTYQTNYPSLPSISLTMKLKAIQISD